MNILVLGKRGSILQWYEHVLSADLPGHTLRGFALNHHNVQERLAGHANRLLFGRSFWQVAGERLRRLLRNYRPDICIIADRFYLQGGVDEALAQAGVPVCQWVGDIFSPRLFDNKSIAYFFFTDSSLLQMAREAGCAHSHYLPLAVDPLKFGPGIAWHKRKEEPLFVGAWSENRQALLSAVKTPLSVYGKGWERMTQTPHRIHAANISLAKVAKLYCSHRVVLNAINSSNIVSGLNMRCFEAPAAGACLVSDNVADLSHCYTAGSEVFVYENASELDDVLSRLARDDALAGQVAAAGQARCLNSHTYAVRVACLLNTVQGGA